MARPLTATTGMIAPTSAMISCPPLAIPDVSAVILSDISFMLNLSAGVTDDFVIG